MNVYELQAKIGLDSSEFESGLKKANESVQKAKKPLSQYNSDVMQLASTYRKAGMDQSEALRKAHKEIDKSQYETAETAKKTSREYANSWEDASGRVSSVASKLNAGVKTIAKFGAAAVAAGAAAITALGKLSIDGYADYEQLVGGVETLFGAGGKSLEEYAASVGKTVDEASSAYESLIRAEQAVLENADNAYKTAGMSANQYMETVTSFSASLLQGLGGNTELAAEIADRAITDMSDNANKMGTDISSIQTAYQGFAKQNYTMLDNLKLGYGGTQAEMARLVNDSGVLGDAFEATASNINEVSFDKIIEAIGVVQDRMGITGTTAKEASETISGSVASMKAAWQNLVAGLANPDADIEVLFDNFIASVETAGGNIGKAVKTFLTNLPALGVQLYEYLKSSVMGTDWRGLGDAASDKLASVDWAMVGSKFMELVGNGFGALGSFLVGLMGDALGSMLDYMLDKISEGQDLGMDMGTAVLYGLLSGLGDIVAWVGTNLIDPFIRGIIDGMTGVEGAGAQVVESIKNGIASGWKGLVSWFEGIWNALFGSLTVGVSVTGSSAGSDGVGGWVGGEFIPTGAIGRDYVPYDNYLMNLHRGEMVLTRSESEEYRRGMRTGGQMVINQYIQTVPQTPVETAAATQSYFEQARWAF